MDEGKSEYLAGSHLKPCFSTLKHTSHSYAHNEWARETYDNFILVLADLISSRTPSLDLPCLGSMAIDQSARMREHCDKADLRQHVRYGIGKSQQCKFSQALVWLGPVLYEC